ncbi:MAG: hypothetical protein JAY60_18600 [Candidatus Thiodiazotropha weberae]|nr:hypothetical protein [Candidatus Thiodiazotropha weberae]
MQQAPILRIELEGLRQSVAHLFNQNQQAMSEMITSTLEKKLQEDWIQEQVNVEVTKAIESAISQISNSYELRGLLSEMLIDQVTKIVSREEP